MSIYCWWLVLFTVSDCYSFSFVFKLCLLNCGIFGEFWPRGLNLASFLAKVFRFRTDQALRRKFPTSKHSKAHLNISFLTNRSQAWLSDFFSFWIIHYGIPEPLTPTLAGWVLGMLTSGPCEDHLVSIRKIPYF